MRSTVASTGNQVHTFFNKWLWLMEDAYNALSKQEFTELENEMRREISFHRRRKP